MNDGLSSRLLAVNQSMNRKKRVPKVPLSNSGKPLNLSQYFGENVFYISKTKDISGNIKKKLAECMLHGKPLTIDLADVLARSLIKWAVSRNVTHFCHWFQPLTGSTAEKHDSLLNFEGGNPIEKLSAENLIHGEPDASSLPHGGSRSTFEARGYTSWDITSPPFIVEGEIGNTLYIPSIFVSYLGDALDIKTPLLRATTRLSCVLTSFLNLTGNSNVKSVQTNVGAEQEYFLVDKSFFYLRPDLLMTGRTLIGSLPPKNQQLEDHYFGSVRERILDFMQELDMELYRLGVPSQTRHNEVAPGQFEIAPMYSDANVASDHNQLIMAYIQMVALKHNFVALLHEKPMDKMNGSGKHINWSLTDDQGNNLFSPGNNPQENYRFLALISMVLLAFYRHTDVIRLSTVSLGNDLRLGGHEAPPCIMSVFIGKNLENIFEAILSGQSFVPHKNSPLDLGVGHLAQLLIDNTDRNRTSPFAFTGNKFEFRTVGSSAAIGLPICLLNASVSEVVDEANQYLKQHLSLGKTIDDCLLEIIRENYNQAKDIVYNGDGYSDKWSILAKERNLPAFKNTYEALNEINDDSIDFLLRQNIFKPQELKTRNNIIKDRYNKLAIIELKTIKILVDQYVLPSTFQYEKLILDVIERQKKLGLDYSLEMGIYEHLRVYLKNVVFDVGRLERFFEQFSNLSKEELIYLLTSELIPLLNQIVDSCNKLEEVIPNNIWNLPKYYEMLFI